MGPDRRRLTLACTLLLSALAACSSTSGPTAATTATTSRATTTTRAATTTTLPAPVADQTPPVQVNGIAVDGDGIWVADFRTNVLLLVDRHDGTIVRRVSTVDDRADDVAVGPDGSAWSTGVVSGGLGRTTGNTFTRFAEVQPGINGIEFAPDGTLYVATGSTLFRLRPGATKLDTLIDDLPDINGFGVLPDGRILAPGGGFGGPGQAVLIDPKARTWRAIASDLPPVAAGTTDPDGVPYLLSNATGQLLRVDVKAGTAKVVRTVELGRPFDNLSFADDGTLYLSSFTTSSLTAVDPDGTMRSIPIGS